MCPLQCLSVVIPVIVKVAVEMLRPASPKVVLGNYYHEMRKINEINSASVLLRVQNLTFNTLDLTEMFSCHSPLPHLQRMKHQLHVCQSARKFCFHLPFH